MTRYPGLLRSRQAAVAKRMAERGKVPLPARSPRPYGRDPRPVEDIEDPLPAPTDPRRTAGNAQDPAVRKRRMGRFGK